jgi:hypothetical protein
MTGDGKDERVAGCDHDLLIRIDTRLALLNTTVLEFEKSSQEDRSRLWAQKAGLADVQSLSTRMSLAAEDKLVQDHEHRLRILERFTYIAVGVLIVLQVIVPIILKFGWPH